MTAWTTGILFARYSIFIHFSQRSCEERFISPLSCFPGEGTMIRVTPSSWSIREGPHSPGCHRGPRRPAGQEGGRWRGKEEKMIYVLPCTSEAGDLSPWALFPLYKLRAQQTTVIRTSCPWSALTVTWDLDKILRDEALCLSKGTLLGQIQFPSWHTSWGSFEVSFCLFSYLWPNNVNLRSKIRWRDKYTCILSC